MEVIPREVLICPDEKGEEPFTVWLETIKDAKTVAIILKRIERVAGGNFGDVEPVGEGVSELKIDYGPGFRVYLGQIETKFTSLAAVERKRRQPIFSQL